MLGSHSIFTHRHRLIDNSTSSFGIILAKKHGIATSDEGDNVTDVTRSTNGNAGSCMLAIWATNRPVSLSDRGRNKVLMLFVAENTHHAALYITCHLLKLVTNPLTVYIGVDLCALNRA